MNIQTILFTFFGMLIDTIVLFLYLNTHNIKQNKRIYAFLAYSSYFIINFVLGVLDAGLWIKILLNILIIMIMGYFLYDKINCFEIGKKAIIFIMLVGISELFVIPVAFILTKNFSTDIFNDPTKPYLWLISMGFSRLIAICLFSLFRSVSKQSYSEWDKQEFIILYLPVTISFICFLIVTKIVLNIDQFNKEEYCILLAAIACALIIYTLIHMIICEKYVHYRNYNQELLMLKQKNELKYEFYKYQGESIENLRILYHDLKNHMLVSNYNTTYFEETKATLEHFEKIVDTGCEILDILLWEKNNEAEKCGMAFECTISKVNLNFISDMDICSIVGNVLDNAIEAGKDFLNEQRSSISVKIGNINNFIIIKVINDCISESKLMDNDNYFITTKADKKLHGIGLSSIKRAVEKYDGHCVFDTHNNKFTAEILIPYPIEH